MTDSEFDIYARIHARLNSALRDSDRIIAIDGSGRSMSGSEAWAKAKAYQSEMRALNPDVGPLVIIGGRALDIFPLIVACLLSRRAFCIMDPESPSPRTEKILDLLSPSVIANQSQHGFVVSKFDAKSSPERKVVDACYVVFTSGSTGEPKGVVVGPESYLPFVDWLIESSHIEPGERFSIINPAHFDNFIADATYVLFSKGTGFVFSEPLTNLARLKSELAASDLAHWFSVPSALRYLHAIGLLSEDWAKGLKWCRFGGEPFQCSEIIRIRKELSMNCNLVNVYGPSETTCISSFHEISPEELETSGVYPPLGQMNHNFDSWLVEKDCELVLVGTQVSRGYLGSLEGGFFQTADGRRGYRTGDVVRVHKGNQYVFVSRIDRQIKLNGHRIEPGEVESCCLSLSGVDEVFASTIIIQGSPSLGICFSGTATAEALKAHIKASLPPYMTPRVVLKVVKLPRNRNGKLDGRRMVDLMENQ